CLLSSAQRILLADADAFYVAVARLADPEGAGKARFLIVGGSPAQRGVVTSASYEARAYGVHSAMPMVRAVRLCPGATVVPVPWEACTRKSGWRALASAPCAMWSHMIGRRWWAGWGNARALGCTSGRAASIERRSRPIVRPSR